MTHAVVLAGGAPPYVDPWHPFAETSRLLAELAVSAGFEVEVAFGVAERLADLSGVDLLIANTPVAELPLEPATLAGAQAGLDGFFARGGGIVALHVSVTTLLGLDGWSDAIGATWKQGTTMHPPRGLSQVYSAGGDAVVDGIGEFTLDDELYTYLDFLGEHRTLVAHHYAGTEHPLVWKRSHGATRVIADALGHGVESYDSPEHRTVLQGSMLWAASVTD